MSEQPNVEWVALLAWEGVGSMRTIHWSPDAESHVNVVSSDLAEGLRVLVEHYTEDVNLGELENVHENYGEGPYPPDGWDFGDVLRLLERLPALAAEEYAAGGNPTVKTCRWYLNLVTYLNELFPDGSGAWVMAEGPIPEGLLAIRDAVARWLADLPGPDDPRVGWLGRWSILSQWTPPLPARRVQALHALIDEFNEANAL